MGLAIQIAVLVVLSLVYFYVGALSFAKAKRGDTYTRSDAWLVVAAMVAILLAQVFEILSSLVAQP